MLLNVYTVWDTKAEAFLQPFFSPNKGTAIRAIVDALRDPNSTLAKYPDDFHLYHIGTWDDSAGLIEAHSPVGMGVLREYVENE